MENCIFCKIIAGDIPASKIYEDEQFIAILDVHPVSKGHLMLIPKEHHDRIYNVPEELAKAYLPVANKLAKAMKKAFMAQNIVYQVWGEDVLHAHLHLIPRYENDGLKFHKQGKTSTADLALQAEKIINKLD